MPGHDIAQANPSPDPSLLDDSVLRWGVELDTKDYLTPEELYAVQMFRRAADYIAAAMIFLNEKNVLVESELAHDHIKPRLLGHWGTCPALSMIYGQLSRIIRKTDLDSLLVVGPGHGAPGILACLWLEDSLSTFYPVYTRDMNGLRHLISKFSVKGGFPSHINAETPGSIHEGGELGYALSVSFGAVMDRPDLVVTCIVGDGEAETGPTATAWHAFKYIDPAESGAVLPIVNANGFKISERTIFGTMDDKEIIALFTGYGYQCRIVSDLHNIDNDLAASMEWALAEIKRIQSAARSGKPIIKPRWPVIVLRTPKGLGGPKSLHDTIIEGSFHSHSVPLPNAGSSEDELKCLETWLRSYKPAELFDSEGKPVKDAIGVVPTEPGKRLGQRAESYKEYSPLSLPNWRDFEVERGTQASCMQTIGKLLKKVVEMNQHSFRIFSPDELASNKLDAVLDATSRNFQWDSASRGIGGRVIEILSEHTCQGFLQGYTMTGRTGLFPSYESFLGIISTMMIQYCKFGKMARETSWRQDISSLNYIETSTWTRQEHNGFSHQNPSFIGSVLNLKPAAARVYLPPDANCFLSTLSHCLRAKNYVNLMVGSKQPTPVWLSPEEADKHCIAGASIFKFASVDEGISPDVVLVGIGVEVTFEVVAAAALLRKMAPDLRVRVVNVTDLMILAPYGDHPHSLTNSAFTSMFTDDRHVHFNYHGCPIELKGLLFGRPSLDTRITVDGYIEEGTTTTPFDMMLCNRTSRYHVAGAAVRGGMLHNAKVAVIAHQLESQLKHMEQKEREYILANGNDRPETYDVPKFD